MSGQGVFVPGAQGPAGPTGATGATGAAGATGATGPTGPANLTSTWRYPTTGLGPDIGITSGTGATTWVTFPGVTGSLVVPANGNLSVQANLNGGSGGMLTSESFSILVTGPSGYSQRSDILGGNRIIILGFNATGLAAGTYTIAVQLQMLTSGNYTINPTSTPGHMMQVFALASSV
jgi:hypothetical protein